MDSCPNEFKPVRPSGASDFARPTGSGHGALNTADIIVARLTERTNMSNRGDFSTTSFAHRVNGLS